LKSFSYQGTQLSKLTVYFARTSFKWLTHEQYQKNFFTKNKQENFEIHTGDRQHFYDNESVWYWKQRNVQALAGFWCGCSTKNGCVGD